MTRPKRPRGWNSSMPARSKRMPRGGGPKRTKGISGGGRLNPFGKRGRRLRREGKLFGPLAEMMRLLPCDLCGHPAPSDPHHVRSRGAGFLDRLPNGDGNLVALCKSDPRSGYVGCHDLVEAERSKWADELAERAREHGEFFDRMREAG